MIQYIEEAARLALAGQVDAICTCPIHKANLQEHGFSFPGHTEFLQELTHAEKRGDDACRTEVARVPGHDPSRPR